MSAQNPDLVGKEFYSFESLKILFLQRHLNEALLKPIGPHYLKAEIADAHLNSSFSIAEIVPDDIQ